MRRLALGLLGTVAALLCSACVSTTGASPEDTPPPLDTPTPTNVAPQSSVAPSSSVGPSSSAPSVSRKPKRATLAFGKSYTWRDGVRVTVGKPRTFKPSRYAVVEKSKHYVKFPITVVNKAEKPIDIGWTHINVQSKDKEADQFYDSLSGLKGPPAKKVSKGREATFEVGFAVADPDDLTMELALDGDRQRPRLRYST